MESGLCSLGGLNVFAQFVPMTGRTGSAACGCSVHGRVSEPGDSPVCFACERPGVSDGACGRWKHVCNTPYWSAISEWTAQVGAGWAHRRDLQGDPLVVGECLCARRDCVYNMYTKFRLQSAKNEKGSWDVMAVGQASPMGRYPSTPKQVRKHESRGGTRTPCTHPMMNRLSDIRC